jgi:hypothetical protein
VATVLANPRWPAMSLQVDFTQGPPNKLSAFSQSLNNPSRGLSVRAFSVDRGRQYELDQVQTGQLTAEVRDPLEYLNPDNSASPFNTGSNDIVPYRAVALIALWPNQPGSGNIINSNLYAQLGQGLDPSFESNLGTWAAAGGTTTLVRSSAIAAFDGTWSMKVTQSAAGAGFGAFNGYSTPPGYTYTFSAYVNLTAQAGLTVRIQVVDGSGATISSATTTTQGSWVRLSVTWNSVNNNESITIFGTGTATPTFYVDAVQLEFGPAVTAFVKTGPVQYSVFSGYVERWPTTYDSAGFRAIRPLQAVDALAVLATTAISQSYTKAITADSPTVYMPLSNSAPPTSGGALSAGSETSQITSYNVPGYPVYHPSQSGSINWGGDTQPDGTPAVVLQQNNPGNPPKVGHTTPTYPNEQETTFDVLPVGITIANTGATIEMWAKFSGGVVLLGQLLSTAVHGGGLNTELGYGASNTQNHIELYTSGGKIFFHVCDAAAGYDFIFDVANNTIPGAGFADGEWHYYSVAFYNSGGSPGLALAYDGVEFDYGGPTGVRNYGFSNLHHDVNTDFGDVQSQASIARFAVYPRDIGSTARAAHYQRGVGYVGETAGARVARLLNLYWAATGWETATGFLALTADSDYDGRYMLDVLQEMQESERGLVYVDANGNIVFEDRTTRYSNGQTSLFTFGENPTGASPVEYPYEDYASDFDPTYVFSQANLTRPGNSNFAPVVNATTQAVYGQRILTQEVKCTTDFDLTQAGIFYTQRYAGPRTRISKLTLHPSANPALWPVLLSLEISSRVTVKRRNAGVTVSRDYYVEKINHQADSDETEWVTELQLSPVFVSQAWVLGDSTYGVLGTTTTPIY